MPALLPDVDPDGLLEFSVVYTDRALNHMSMRFQSAMRGVSDALREVYGAAATAIVPGSGTFGMESVARQFATDRRALVLRNGFFSYRWSQILEMGRITAPEHITVLMARATAERPESPFAPAPIDEVVQRIGDTRPHVVFAPHVETASGMLLPDDYLRRVAEATHAAGGLFVLDCIASGALWVDMRAIGVDVLVSAPQKGWSSAPGFAMLGLSERALAAMEDTTSTSFAMDLKKWRQIMKTYDDGGHAYHATLPTGAIAELARAMAETRAHGFERARAEQIELGRKVRALFESRGMPSVAAAGFQAPGVVVSYTQDADVQSGKKFIAHGVQSAAGVPLMVGEAEGFRTFRVGLFGLDKWAHVERTVGHLRAALDAMGIGERS